MLAQMVLILFFPFGKNVEKKLISTKKIGY